MNMKFLDLVYSSLKYSTLNLLLGILVGFTANTYAAPPVVSGITVSQRAGTHLVDISYNVSDADGDSPLTVYLLVSDNAGLTYNVPVFTTSGAVGPGVIPGNGRSITWNAGIDWPGRFNDQCRVKIIADDGTAPQAPADMVYIPAGAFEMGDNNLDGNIYERPVHTVFISAFFIDKYEVRIELYQSVQGWSEGNGYVINDAYIAGANHPALYVNWYDAVKWCNARSEMEGLKPFYYTDSSKTTVYRTGELDINNDCVDWSANGYRLPTEAEWEKAARGGVSGNRYPWGNSFSGNEANYYYDSLWYASSPAGSYAANGYGIYDISGNAFEWCWDWYDPTWYGRWGATRDNTRGPDDAKTHRVMRGGSFGHAETTLRCAARNADLPNTVNYSIGLRCVRGITN